MLSQNIPFVLFACVVPVKGAERSTLCDVQRENIFFIPNSLYEILITHKGKTLAAIKQFYNNEYDDTIEEYFSFLYEQEYIFFSNEPDLFPAMSLFWNEPFQITNAIIDVGTYFDNMHDVLLQQLILLDAVHIQFRSFTPRSVLFWQNILDNMETKRIISVDIITPYLKAFDFQICLDFIQQYPRVHSITIFNAPLMEAKELDSMGNLLFTTQNITSAAHCGIIDEKYFSNHIKTFTESQHHNTCLNRKISIDSEGFIKNCPSMAHHFGHISEVKLEDVIKNPEFTKYWHIKKDQISVCKDCEFRHICTDCRAYIENPDDLYSKPLKCGYNPYTCEWAEWSTNPLKEKAMAHYGFVRRLSAAVDAAV
jgi:SPASM domain peptide maturase of grasp-with-spasm system